MPFTVVSGLPYMVMESAEPGIELAQKVVKQFRGMFLEKRYTT